MPLPEVLDREWGTETIIAKTPTYCGKILRMKKGTKGGYQFHRKRESHYLLEGLLSLRVYDHVTTMTPGSCWTTHPYTPHQEEALEDCVIFEVSEPLRDDRIRLDKDPGGLPDSDPQQLAEQLRAYAESLTMRGLACQAEAHALESG